MKTKASLGLLVVVFCFATLGLGSSATIWSLSGNFSSTNPDGAWAVGSKERVSGVPTGAFHLSTTLVSSSDLFGWLDSPNWSWKNTSDHTLYGIAPGEVSVSSDDTATSTIRWTAPETGVIDLSGYFGVGDQGRGNRAVFFNQAALFPYAGLVNYTFQKTFAVTAGDTLDFTVWDGFYGGNTPVEATIHLVPEPSSYALLLIGVGAMALCRNKPKASTGR